MMEPMLMAITDTNPFLPPKDGLGRVFILEDAEDMGFYHLKDKNASDSINQLQPYKKYERIHGKLVLTERYRSSVLCPYCGENIIKIYFHSPTWTWKSLCGRAGDLYICPKCRTQKDFILTKMN